MSDQPQEGEEQEGGMGGGMEETPGMEEPGGMEDMPGGGMEEPGEMEDMPGGGMDDDS
jgi:hypothetical protein